MLYSHMIVWGAGGMLIGALAAADSLIGAINSQADLWRHECARQIVQMSDQQNLGGPLFFEEGLLFTSVTANNGKPILIVQTRMGVYAASLPQATIHRLRFEVPLSATTKSLPIYLSYYHNDEIKRRYFDFSVQRPPKNNVKEDYRTIQLTANPALKNHLDFLLLEQIEITLTAALDGKVKMSKGPQDISVCNRLAQVTPSLQRYAKRSLAAIEVMFGEKKSRMPASVFSKLPN